jgi:hypothetical protein
LNTRLLVDQEVTTSASQQLKSAAASLQGQTPTDVYFASSAVSTAWDETVALREHRAAALEQLATATADTVSQGVIELLATDRAMAGGLS